MKTDNSEKIYYTLIDNTKEGPLSLNDLKNIRPTSDTLIWYYGVSDWKKISEIDELKEELKYHIQPPGVNFDNRIPTNNISIEEEKISETLNNSSLNKSSLVKKAIFSKSEVQFIIGWLAFHSLALLTSYGEVKGFNERGWHSAKIIWPFHTQWFWCNSGGASLLYTSGTCESNGGILTFNGLFTAYDIADFLLYVGLSLFVMLFIYIGRKNK
jgi:GYF domain 2